MEQVFPIDLPPGAAAPHLREALGSTVPQIVLAECLQLASGHVASGDYLAKFSVEGAIRYPYKGDPDAVAVVNTSAHASFVEEGHEGFHLPSRIRHWKIGKHGQRYLHIMFRHYTPGDAGGGITQRARQMMPEEVYARAEKLRPRQRLLMPTGRGSYRQSKSYDFYRKAFGGLPTELETLLKHSPQPHGYTWKASPYAGMKKVGRATPKGGGHTRYITFRTITPDSTGWYIPPSPGLHIMQRAIQNTAPDIWAVIDAAVAADLAQLAADAVDV